MGKHKDFSTVISPFDNYRAAAEAFIPVPKNHTDNATSNNSPVEQDFHEPNANVASDTPADVPVNKKTREARDKEKGLQHMHVILPAQQVDAIKTMSKISGLSMTDFLTHVFDKLINGDWEPLLTQNKQTQKKLGFGTNTISKTLFGDK